MTTQNKANNKVWSAYLPIVPLEKVSVGNANPICGLIAFPDFQI